MYNNVRTWRAEYINVRDPQRLGSKLFVNHFSRRHTPFLKTFAQNHHMNEIMEYAGKRIYVIINDEQEITGVLLQESNGREIQLDLENGNIEGVAVADITEYGLA